MVLFGIPFAAIGVGALGMFIWTLAIWGAMQSWQEVPAYIQKTNLIAHRANSSQKEPSYTLEVQYTYQWENKYHAGKELTICTMDDNYNSFYERVYAELDRYHRRNEAFRCYVNPKDPTQSVLYRNLRMPILGFMLLFAFSFGGVGSSLVFFAFYTPQRKTKKPAVQQQYPDEPWLEKKEWREGVIHSHSRIIAFLFPLAAFFLESCFYTHLVQCS